MSIISKRKREEMEERARRIEQLRKKQEEIEQHADDIEDVLYRTTHGVPDINYIQHEDC